MKHLQRLFFPIQNCEETVFYLCKALDVPITQTSLTNALSKHPDYPSLLSISDILQNYGIDNVSLRIKAPENLINIETAFIVQIKEKETHTELFAVVYGMSDEKVDWQNPITHKRENITFRQFKALFTGYVQVYEKTDSAGEENYKTHRKKEKATEIFNNILALSIPLLTLLISSIAFVYHGINALWPALYTLVTLAGAITGGLLILYEVDQHNPSLRKVCTAGIKSSCVAVLHSKGSRIFNIHWSVIGFSYFMGVLAVLLSTGMSNLALLSVAAWLNVLALPYTIYSIGYQTWIVRKWCPMCMAVQGELLLLFAISFLGGLLINKRFSLLSLLPFIISIGFVFLATYLLLPALEKAKTAKHRLLSLQRMKHNPQVFEALLNKQRQITESADNLGITLGNPNGKYKLIKVCNPYCEPCARAHPIIERLLKNNPEIELRIIFLVTEDETNYKNKPVKTLLSLSQMVNKQQLSDALDNWYLQPEKKYENFEKRYPFDKKVLDAQLPAIKKMREWCKEMDVTATPTFFINNHQLPDIYSVVDLQYFLSV